MRKRLTAAVLSAGLLVVAVGGPASAHTLSTDWQLTYKQSGPGGKCMKQIAYLSHSSTYPGGRFRTGVEGWAWTWTPWTLGYDCGAPVYLNKWVNQIVYKWTGSTWAICYNTPWYFSSKNEGYRYTLYNDRPSSPPCGAGTYTIGGWAGIDWDSSGSRDVERYRELANYSATWYHDLN